MEGNTKFQRFIPDEVAEPSLVKKVILCSGQVYYTLKRTRDMNEMTSDVAIVRVEQLSPFPHDLVAPYLEKFPKAEVIWLQEEPMNMGAWTYVQPRIDTDLRKINSERRVRYIGRAPSASVAAGRKKVHVKEEIAFLAEALLGKVQPPKEIKEGVPKWF